ncbi:hypothetical protein MJ570_00790 [Escherichia coli]|nr:hypothetical protein MJ570_00790 [Escherichia coli]
MDFYYELPRFFMELKFFHAVKSITVKEAAQNNLSGLSLQIAKVFLSLVLLASQKQIYVCKGKTFPILRKFVLSPKYNME